MSTDADHDAGARAHTTLIERLAHRAGQDPERVVFTFLSGLGAVEETLTFRALWEGAGALAQRLDQHAAPGDRVILLFPSGLSFITAFYACLRAGLVAVPAWPPDPASFERSLGRLRAMTADARPAVLVCPGAMLEMARALTEDWPGLAGATWVATDGPTAATDATATAPHVVAGASDLAMLQYTSGSTGAPRGVMVEHRHLVANVTLFSSVYGLSPGRVLVSWLPLHHDLVLIGGVLAAVHSGLHSVLLAPQTFLRRPAVWLEAVHQHRAYVTMAPDFAYARCARRVKPEQRASLELSSLRVALTAAEPVRAATIVAFMAAFAASGFGASTFAPSYGLAEATLYVSGAPGEGPPTILRVSRQAPAAPLPLPASTSWTRRHVARSPS